MQVLGGRYRLLDQIGAGAMGTVWRVLDLRNNTVCAGKVLKQSDAGAFLRFMRETTTRVSHPHVVMPTGWAGEDDHVVFAMPLVTGGTLEDVCRRHGSLPPLFAAEITRQMAHALQAVHDSRLVHRDLKPGNILLQATGQGQPFALLTDFGIAAEVNGPRLTQTSVVLGTLGYMAPEILRGNDSHATQDIFGLGACLYVMLTGQKPERSGTFADVHDVPAPAQVPPSLWALLQDMVAWDPDTRPLADEVCARLNAPELAWRTPAIGDINISAQISTDPHAMPDGAQGTPSSWSADAPAIPPAPPTGRDRIAQPHASPAQPPPPPAKRGMPDWLKAWLRPIPLLLTILVIGVIVAAVAAINAWSILGQLMGWKESNTKKPAATSTPDETATQTPTQTSVQPSSSPTTTTATTTTAPRVTTPTSLGDSACSRFAVGTTRREGGVAYVCTKRDDGSYLWVKQ